MTKQRTFKRRVRERMTKTGESYTAARRMLIAQGERPDAAPPDFEPPVADARVLESTGRGWDEWLRMLDDWGAAGHTHTETARWLREEHGVAGWYSQAITVGFERARGLRAPGERPDGFVAGTSRTVDVPVERLYIAVTDDAERERWLPGAELGVRTATAPRSARYDWEDGSTRLIAGFEALGVSKSRVSLSHERLPDAETAAEMKAWWRERLSGLKSLLEDGGASSR